MQLQLTLEELKLLADMLDERDSRLRQNILQADTPEAKQELQRKQVIGDVLLDKIMSFDLRLAADELDNMADILVELTNDLRTRMAQAPAAFEEESIFAQKKQLRDHIRDKVTEATAMA
jgi:hypothetical protein